MGIKLRMFLNVVFDFILGLLPVVGDILDILFRANVCNARLLEHVLKEPSSRQASSRQVV